MFVIPRRMYVCIAWHGVHKVDFNTKVNTSSPQSKVFSQVKVLLGPLFG